MQSDMEGLMAEAPDACFGSEAAEEGMQEMKDDEMMAMEEEMMEEGGMSCHMSGGFSGKSVKSDGYMFKKDITWQDREFNFEEE